METKAIWILDPSHSEITFKVRHLMIANVKGEFRQKQGEVITNGNDFSQALVSLTIDASSIDTNDENRDKHLRSADFFDAEKHKDITFKSTALKKLDEHNYQLKGMLSMKGVGREVVLDVEFGGINKDPWGHEKAGFSVSGKINRKNWGLNWNASLETGGVLVSEEVKINAEVQFVKQA